MIVGGFLNRKKGVETVLKNYRKWGVVCKKAKMHLFAVCFYQADPRSWEYRRVVYSDGTVGKAPCPRGRKHWKWFLNVASRLAKLSLEPELQVDGIFLDCELYGTKGRKRRYSEHTCYCDDCFSSFLLARDYTGSQLPALEFAQRRDWLKKAKLLDDYFSFLGEGVRVLAQNFASELHKINPNLLIGMYPYVDRWVYRQIAGGLGSETMPVIIFAQDTYRAAGASGVPKQPRQYYAKQGVQAVHAAGLVLYRYRAKRLEPELPAMCRKC